MRAPWTPFSANTARAAPSSRARVSSGSGEVVTASNFTGSLYTVSGRAADPDVFRSVPAPRAVAAARAVRAAPAVAAAGVAQQRPPPGEVVEHALEGRGAAGRGGDSPRPVDPLVDLCDGDRVAHGDRPQLGEHLSQLLDRADPAGDAAAV